MPKTDLLHVSTVPLAPTKRLSKQQYAEVERFLKDWKKEVLDAVKRHPKQSYALGRAQSEAFLKLLGRLNTTTAPATLGPGPTTAAAVNWLQTYTLHELDTSLETYISKIKDALLYGLHGAVNPVQVASWLQKATRDTAINWRTIARTEMVRANAAGRLSVCREQGYDRVWAPPHAGACRKCKRLLENKVFRIDEVEGTTNFGREPRDWVACIPLHPHCRHCWVPYIPEVFDEMMRQYDAFQEAGLTDDVLDEMFESGGQLKPEYKDDPRLAAFKSADPFAHAMAHVLTKVRNGQLSVSKGFFDNPQLGLDPLLWEGKRLRAEVRDHVVRWWRETLGDDAALWSHVYLMGGATSPQWESVRQPEPDPDVDLQIVVDYPKLREKHDEWKVLSDPELHGVLVTRIKAALVGVEVAPGVRLDAFIRPETTYAEFEADARLTGQAVYDVTRHRWLVQPVYGKPAERYGVPIMEGVGATTAMAHPDWLDEAGKLADLLSHLLDEYASEPTLEIHEALQSFYTRVHDLRKEGFEGADGNASRGNFIWQYLVNYGPLMRLKHALQPETMAKVYPDHVWSLSPSEDNWRVVKANHWPLPVGTEVLTKAGEADYIFTRTGPSAYTGIGGEPLPHDDIYAYVRKVAAAVHPDAGVEHWITVHPNGPGTDGTPVLVRNESDGSMRVIGGAGGSLDQLHLDRAHKIDPKDKKVKDEAAPGEGLGPVEQPEMKPQGEEAMREFEEKQAQAKEHLESASEQLKGVNDRIRDRVKDYLSTSLMDDAGNPVDWDSLPRNYQTTLVTQAKKAALHTLTAGKLSDDDKNDEPLGLIVRSAETGELLSPKTRALASIQDELDVDEKPKPEPKERTPSEGEDKPRGPSKPKVVLTHEQADSLMDLVGMAKVHSKQAKTARQVLGGNTKVANALALDYYDSDLESEADKAKASAIQAEVRTQVNRDILQTAESEVSKKDKMASSLQQGGYDTLDSVAAAVLGQSQINPEVGRFLGIGGTAQLVAWKLRKEATERGLDLNEVLQKANDVGDARNSIVSQRALARGKTSAAKAVAARQARMEIANAGDDADSLLTESMARSQEQKQMIDAAATFGMAIGGIEAMSALKVALKGATGGKIRVGGFTAPSEVMKLAQKAKFPLSSSDVIKHGPGDYSVNVDPEKLEHLFQKQVDPHADLKKKIEAIRTADDESDLIQSERGPMANPGMSQTLSEAQVKGRMFLHAAQHGVLAFAPGVGKTHTGLAAGMAKLHELRKTNPNARILIVAPPTAAEEWHRTVQAQAGCPFSVQTLGSDFWTTTDPKTGEDVKHSKGISNTDKQLGNPADINIVTYDKLARDPEAIKEKFGNAVVIADEAQKFKNENTRSNAMDVIGEGADNRWALTGTPLEKSAGEFHNLLKWAAPEDVSESRKQFADKYDSISQYEHLTAEDRIQAFQEGVSHRVFALSANNAGNNLAPHNAETGGRPKVETVPLAGAHREHLRQTARRVDKSNAETREMGGKVDTFGNLRALQDATYRYPGKDNALHARVAEMVQNEPVIDYKGKGKDDPTAGSYQPKTLVFSESVRSLEALKTHLEGKGIKVFMGHGQMTSKKNSEAINSYLAHKGRCVFLSSSKNETARSLQFGENKGDFQHGATHTIHFDLPDNNARIAQREARISRKGCAVPTHSTILAPSESDGSSLPMVDIQHERLSREKRRMDLVGNPEDVKTGTGGEKVRTLRQRLSRKAKTE